MALVGYEGFEVQGWGLGLRAFGMSGLGFTALGSISYFEPLGAAGVKLQLL